MVAGRLIILIHMNNNVFFLINRVAFLGVVSYFWWRDVVRESTFLRFHIINVQQRLIIRFILFIASEVLFFFRFFWTLFDSGLSPVVDVRRVWPPFFLVVLDPLGVPLLNTVVLLCSRITVTHSHYSIIERHLQDGLYSLVFTLVLRRLFTLLQRMEYYESSFSISERIYRSVFFIATGFHRFHVIVGSLFLLVQMLRINSRMVLRFQHVGFISAIWYWHFVDVVWIFLYISLYWWRSK